jgi:hypothetical protein
MPETLVSGEVLARDWAVAADGQTTSTVRRTDARREE